MKVMSIINLIWAPLSLVFIVIVALSGNAATKAMLLMLGLLIILGFAHTTVFSIVVLKGSKNAKEIQEIVSLKELKEKGILSEEEFQAKTIELLKM